MRPSLILTVMDSVAKATSARKKRAVNNGKGKRLLFMGQTDTFAASLAREMRYAMRPNRKLEIKKALHFEVAPQNGVRG